MVWYPGGGVSKYDGRTFSTFDKTNGLVSDDCSSILVDKKGNIWFGSGNDGVSIYDGKSFKSISSKEGLAGNEIAKIFEDRQGNIWFATNAEGVSKYDGKSFTTNTTKQGLAGNVLISFAQDKLGNMWFGTIGNGISKYDGKTFTNYTTEDGLAGNIVISILVDKDSVLWVGTFNEGVSRYDGTSFTNFSTEQGLAGKSVWSIIQDHSDNIWFATYDGGICKYEKKSFTSFSTKQGLAGNIIRSIAEDKNGHLWFGSLGGGVSQYDGKSFITYSIAQGIADENIRCIHKDKIGNLWFGTYGKGISKYDGKSFTTYTTDQGLAGDNITCIAEDKSGILWVGSRNGVSRFDGKSFQNFSTEHGLVEKGIYCITTDYFGNIWFGSANGGISKFNGKSFTTFSTEQGLANNEVQSILSDKKGNLWIGTMGGGLNLISKENLYAINKNDFKAQEKLFTNFSTADSLPSNMITQIVENDNGKLFIGTKSGICELYPSTTNPKGWRLGQVYNAETGYLIKDVNTGQNALFQDSKGILWIATGSNKTALLRIDPNSLSRDKAIPKLIIQNIKINNENICWNDLITTAKLKSIDSNCVPPNITEEVNTFGKILSEKERANLRRKFGDISFDSISKWNTLPENLCLPFRNNNVSFEFNALETGSNYLIKYQYMLEGYDKDWSPVSNRTTANFGNIFEGTYTFLVKAQNSQGIWSTPIRYTLTVHPPWWRTWWMYVAYFLLTVLLIGGYIKWSQRKLKKQNIILGHKVSVAVKEMKEEKDKSDNLLLNILPSEVAEELKQTGTSTAKNYSQVTILFTDFKNFTSLSESMSAQELVNEIDYCYSAFDKIITKHNIEKIKTIGDSYMCAGGLPIANKTNAEDTIRAAIEIRDFITSEQTKRKAAGLPYFEIRIGINTGPVVAGIVGIKKFAYDIWGDSVNIASRMESSGVPGKVNISGNTYELVKDKFKFEHRGKVEAKNKGMVEMYFVENLYS